MLTHIRLKSVKEHLNVVLRAHQDLSEQKFCDVLDELRAVPSTNIPADPCTTSLQFGPVDVVGIYTLTPWKEEGQAMNGDARQRPASLWHKVKQAVSRWVKGIMQRARMKLHFYSSVRWGLRVPSLMFAWLKSLGATSRNVIASDIYDHKQWSLETMCIAKHLQGQGVGSAVMKHIQAELSKCSAVGLRGLCQSKETAAFYIKCGFKSREVFTMDKPSPYRPGETRKHYLVAWSVPGLYRGVPVSSLDEREPGKGPCVAKSMCIDV